MRPKIQFYAMSYLNQWLSNDRRYVEAIRSTDRSDRLKAVADAMQFYRVARNLPVKYDKGPRYSAILDILDEFGSPLMDESTVVSFVRKAEREISAAYGGHSVTSLTTKLLWVWVQNPVVIFDSRARRALNARSDLEDYYTRWRRGYGGQVLEIQRACAALPEVRAYCADGHISVSELNNVVNKPWFHERVYDVMLWNNGGVRPR